MAYEVVVIDERAQITTSRGEFSDSTAALFAAHLVQLEVDEEGDEDVYVEVRPIR